MASKQHILKAVRQQPLADVELPDLDQPSWITYPDRKQQFAAVLEAVGGQCRTVAGADPLQQELATLPVYARAAKICAQVPGLQAGNVDADQLDDPHQLEDVDVAVLPGEFAVAENAAVWVTAKGMRHRALYFLVQHLILVVPAAELLDNMHQAYQRLAFEQSEFGVFISGPSKTADIEQSLVIGAHGPRSLTVFLQQP